MCVTFFRVALFDGDVPALVEGPVDAGRRRRDVEGHAGVARASAFMYVPILFGDVARARRPVGAHDDDVDRRPASSGGRPALSTMSVSGRRGLASSHAVRNAPWFRGRVSDTQTWTVRPNPCASTPGRAPFASTSPPPGVAMGHDTDRRRVRLVL